MLGILNLLNAHIYIYLLLNIDVCSSGALGLAARIYKYSIYAYKHSHLINSINTNWTRTYVMYILCAYVLYIYILG